MRIPTHSRLSKIMPRLLIREVPGFTAQRIVVREFHADDVATLADSANSPSVAHNLLPHFPQPYTRDNARSWISRCQGLYERQAAAKDLCEGSWAVVSQALDAEAVIGGIGIIPLHGPYSRTADIGFWLSERFWGQGIVPAVLKHLIKSICGQFPNQLTRLNGKHFTRNTASGRVFEKCGFCYEGTFRHMALDRNNEIQDEAQWAFYLCEKL